jgi:DNA-directed RNA polymerase subunit RPC12/RpoP
MVEINCLVCGKAIEIPEFIDTNNYDGQIACPGCKSLLQVKLVGGKVRKYTVAERKSGSATAAASGLSRRTGGEAVDVESVAKYNPLRDYLATYRAAQLNMTFEHIEHIIESKLETAAYTFKSWWANDRRNPQAIAWLEAGWEVDDVDLQRRGVVFKRVKQSSS